jgi:inorganic phosphate transporter, PiT family
VNGSGRPRTGTAGPRIISLALSEVNGGRTGPVREMNVAFVLAVAMALAFAFTNGFHDAANAIATLVGTRVGRPGPAVALASVFNMAGPFLVGAAVANTVAKIVQVEASHTIAVIGAGLSAAVLWNVLTWWRGLPSSSSHALLGGLVGAALVDARSLGAVNWGHFEGLKVNGVFGLLIALAVSPLLGFAAAAAIERSIRPHLGRATVRLRAPIRSGQWVTTSWLAFSHGANDAQKSVGIVAALLVAHGTARSVQAIPIWVIVSCAAVMTLGTGLGGWRIVKTIGRRIFRLRELDGLVSQASSAAVILGASLVGAPLSTTHVVASSVIGAGVGRGRRRHVGWKIVRSILVAWATTLPATMVIAALFLPLWRWLA